MIDVDKIVKEQADKMVNATEEQKQNFTEMATAFGNFMNCIWKQKVERNTNGTDKPTS